jgi:integrase
MRPIVSLHPKGATMLDDYTRHLRRRRLSPRTIHLRTYWIERLARTHDLATVTLEQLEDYVYSGDWSQNTQQTLVASLRSYFQWAQTVGVRDDNPTHDLLRIRITDHPTRRIASDTAIRNGIRKATRPEEAMLRLGAECGLRVSEIAALHRNDRDGEWLTFTGKGAKVRTVHIEPELAECLDWIEQNSMRWGYYFPGRSGGHAHLTTIWRHIRNLIDLNPHALRRRAGTTVYRGTGKDVRVAQSFLGHASIVTTQDYLEVEREDLLIAGAAARLAA